MGHLKKKGLTSSPYRINLTLGEHLFNVIFLDYPNLEASNPALIVRSPATKNWIRGFFSFKALKAVRLNPQGFIESYGLWCVVQRPLDNRNEPGKATSGSGVAKFRIKGCKSLSTTHPVLWGLGYTGT